jgi:hypothetical protein
MGAKKDNWLPFKNALIPFLFLTADLSFLLPFLALFKNLGFALQLFFKITALSLVLLLKLFTGNACRWTI